MTKTMKTVALENTALQTIWNRTFAPLRKALSGTWEANEDKENYSLTFDQYGRFTIQTGPSNATFKGWYIIEAATNPVLRLSSEDGAVIRLAIEHLNAKTLILQPEENTALPFRFQKINQAA